MIYYFQFVLCCVQFKNCILNRETAKYEVRKEHVLVLVLVFFYVREQKSRSNFFPKISEGYNNSTLCNNICI